MENRVTSAAEGERRALIGLIPQYKLCAKFVYNALIEGRLDWLQILSNDAGQVDDFLIGSPNRLDAYQVKYGQKPDSYTLNSLLRPTKTSSGKVAESLVGQLSSAWMKLQGIYINDDVHVHLVQRGIPSTVGAIQSLPKKFQSENFHLFLESCWTSDNEPETKWSAVLDCIKQACDQISDEDFDVFRQHCHFDFINDIDPPRGQVNPSMGKDIERIQNHLLDLASLDTKPGRITREELLHDLTWDKRFQSAFPHEFQIDPRYQPIEATVEKLENALSDFDSGYIRLIGSPGSGKSTTLTHTLRGLGHHRLVKYYCFINNDLNFSRGEAVNFFHDLVIQLGEIGIKGRRGFAPETLEELRNEFSSQLAHLESHWRNKGEKTIILIDGLDHVQREQNPSRSLIAELPPPTSLPDGVLICLGSQKTELNDLSLVISNQLRDFGRTIEIQSLSRSAICSYLNKSELRVTPTSNQTNKVVELSEGHPLFLAFLTQKLKKADSSSEVDVILQDTTQFQGNIESNYNVFWNELENDNEMLRLLAYVARMRGIIDLEPLLALVSGDSIKRFSRATEPYLIFTKFTQCRFFHNSFRQFVLSLTRQDEFGRISEEKDALFHRELAEVAAKLPFNKPYAWEALYHAYCAKDNEHVVRLATIERFREQARCLRHHRYIFDDIKLSFDAIRQVGCHLSAISMVLTSREMRRRFYHLNDIDFTSLLIAMDKPDACIHRFLRNGVLAERPTSALLAVGTLIEKGYLNEARNLFEISEPVLLLEGSDEVKLNSLNAKSDLSAWASVACEFRSVKDVLSAIMRARISARSWRNDSPEAYAYSHRKTCIKNVIDFLISRANWNQVDQLLEFFNDHEDFQSIQLGVDRRICNNYPRDPRALASLARLESSFDNSADQGLALALANYSWFIRRDKQAAERWLSSFPSPDTPEKMGLDDCFSAYENRLAYSRLLSILGHSVSLYDNVSSLGDSEQDLRVYLDRLVARIGSLWGQGIVQDVVDPASIRNTLTSFIRFFEQDFEDSSRPYNWHTIQKECYVLFGWFFKAAVLHGDDALSVVSEEIDEICCSAPYWPWSFENIRKICLSLYEVDQDKDVLIKRLSNLVLPNDASFDASFRISFYYDQAIAFTKVGEEERAATCFDEMMDNTCGFDDSREDDEISLWVNWFSHQAKREDSECSENIKLLASTLATLEANRRGVAISESIHDLGQKTGQLDAGWAQKLWLWWLDEGTVSWVDANGGSFYSFITNSEISLELIIIAINRLHLPWSISSNGDLARAFGQRLYRDETPEESKRLLESLINTLSTKSFSSVRLAWHTAIHEAANRAGRLPPLMSMHGNGKDEHDSAEATNPNKLEPKNESQNFLDNALSKVDSAESAVSILLANESKTSYGKSELTSAVFERIPAVELEAFANMILDSELDIDVLTVISRRLISSGKSDHAKRIADRAFNEASSTGWKTHYDGGRCFTAGAALVEAYGSEGRDIVFRRWLRDMSIGDVGVPDNTDDFEKLLLLIFEDIPYRELWVRLRTHIDQFLEVRSTYRAISTNFDLEEVTVGPEISKWFDVACTFEIPYIENEAAKGLIELMGIDHCRDEMELLLDRWFADDDHYKLRALSLIHASCKRTLSFAIKFTTDIQKCSGSESILVRKMAIDVLNILEVSPIGIDVGRRKLPVIYSMVIPRITEPEYRQVPDSSYAPGKVTPETEDHWEWVSVIQYELRLLEKFSGIPIQNLVRRIVQLMQDIAPRVSWDANAEKKLKGRIQSADLYFSYTRPRAKLVGRALDRVICELIDGGKVSIRESSDLLSRINPIDLVALGHQQILRPDIIEVPVNDQIPRLKDDNWLSAVGEVLPKCAVRAQDGRHVIAEFTRIRRWSYDKPEEWRFSSWAIRGFEIGESDSSIDSFFPWNSWWRIDEYPEFPDSRNEGLFALYVNPVAICFGRNEYITVNPMLCKALGWSLSKEGITRWTHGDKIMIETVRWQDGPLYNRAEIENEQISSDGWLILAHPLAAAQIAKKFSCISVRRVVRKLGRAFSDEEEHCHVADQFFDVSDLMEDTI